MKRTDRTVTLRHEAITGRHHLDGGTQARRNCAWPACGRTGGSSRRHPDGGTQIPASTPAIPHPYGGTHKRKNRPSHPQRAGSWAVTDRSPFVTCWPIAAHGWCMCSCLRLPLPGLVHRRLALRSVGRTARCGLGWEDGCACLDSWCLLPRAVGTSDDTANPAALAVRGTLRDLIGWSQATVATCKDLALDAIL